MLALYLGVIVAATVAVWKGSALLESSSSRLAGHYRLPPLVEGTILVAVGSSFPEISTTVISAAFHGQFDLGVSVILGSAIFNILVIPGLSVLVAKKLRWERLLVYRDAQFYLISIGGLTIAFCLAVIYHPLEGDRITGRLTREIALLPILLYFIYLFLQHQETREFRVNDRDDGSSRIDDPGKQWLVLLAGLALILVGVEGLLRSAIFLGDHLGTPSALWGMTVVAAATSIPDAFVSIRLAHGDRGTVSVGNVLGSNIVDLLVAVPLGVLVAGASSVDFSTAAPLTAFLTAATILLFVCMRAGLDLGRLEGGLLLSSYAGFVAWRMIETFALAG